MLISKQHFYVTCPILVTISALVASVGFYTAGLPNPWIAGLLTISLAPLFVSMRVCSQKVKYSLFLAWWFGFILEFIAFQWFVKPMIYFGGLEPILAMGLFVFICAVVAVYFVLLFSPFTVGFWLLQNESKLIFPTTTIKNIIVSVSMLFAATGLEIIIPRFFHWTFGSLLNASPILNQLTSLFGMSSGTVFIFTISLFVSKISINNSAKKNIFISILILFISSSVYFFGHWRIEKYNKKLLDSHKAIIAFLQPNFLPPFLTDRKLPTESTTTPSFFYLINMSTKILNESYQKFHSFPELLIWPESTAPDFFFYHPAQIEKVRKISEETHTTFLVQAIKIDKASQANNHLHTIWSASGMVTKNGLEKTLFEKWTPMPFGESFPTDDFWSAPGNMYRSIFKNAGKIKAGHEFKPLVVNPKLKVTPLICFDAISQELAYKSSKWGNTNLYVNQDNLIWMVDSNAGYELAVLNQMRSLETGRSLIMASNSGPSMVFDGLGRLLTEQTPLLEPSEKILSVPTEPIFTLYLVVWQWPLVISGFVSTLLLCICLYSVWRYKVQNV